MLNYYRYYTLSKFLDEWWWSKNPTRLFFSMSCRKNWRGLLPFRRSSGGRGRFCIPHYSFIESYFHKYGGLNTPFMSAVIYKEARVAVRLRENTMLDLPSVNIWNKYSQFIVRYHRDVSSLCFLSFVQWGLLWWAVLGSNSTFPFLCAHILVTKVWCKNISSLTSWLVHDYPTSCSMHLAAAVFPQSYG